MKAKKLLLILFSAFALTSCDLNKVSSSSPQSSPSDSSSSSSEPSAHEHTYSDEWKSDKDNHWHEATCGHNEISEKGPHRYEDTVTPSTYEGGGYTTHTCKDCGYSYKDSETPALEHKYATTWMYDEETHWHACIDEGYENLRKDEAKHSYSSVVTSPTCTEDGYTTYVCECGASYTSDTKEKLGHSYSEEWERDENTHWHEATCGHEVRGSEGPHDYKEEVVSPTYERGGYTTYTCKTCGRTYQGNETPALTHTYSTEWKSDKKSHWHECLDKGFESLKGEEAEHTFGDWVDGKIGEDGKEKKTRTCSVCNHVEDKIIDYKVDEEGWISAFKAVRNFTSRTFYESEEYKYKYEAINKADHGVGLYSTVEISNIGTDNERTEAESTLIEMVDEPGVKVTTTYYSYDQQFDIWERRGGTTLTYEELKEAGYDDALEAIYVGQEFGLWLDKYASFSFNQENGTYCCDSLTFISSYNYATTITDVAIKMDDGNLTNISYKDSYGRQNSFFDFGTTKIDESFRDKIHEHTYDESAWAYDKQYHWHPANCEHKGEFDDHIYISGSDKGGFADGYDEHDFVDSVCSVCGYKCKHFENPKDYIRETNDGLGVECSICDYKHTHDDVTNEKYVVYDEYNQKHGKKCPSCGLFVRSTIEYHHYENCFCKECDFANHDFKYDYSSDSQYHWREITCSHTDIENPTKEEHDYELFGDICSTCYHLNNHASSDTGGEVAEDAWKKNFEAVDLNNLTMLYVGDKVDGASKMKFSGIYEELIHGSRDGRSDLSHELCSFEDETNYRYYSLEDGSYERREMFDGERIVSSGDVSYKRDFVEKVKTISFSEFEFDSTYGMYKLNRSSEHSSDFDYRDVYVKFANGKLVYIHIGDIDSSSGYTAFYDFGATEIETPNVSKTYTLADEYDGNKSNYYHYFVFECGEEKRTFQDAYEQHFYEANDEYEAICSICGHQCQHSYSSGTPYCSYCRYAHVHEINDEGWCSACGRSDEASMRMDNLFVLSFAYSKRDSFTVKKEYYYGDQTEPSSVETSYITSTKEKIVSGKNIEYHVNHLVEEDGYYYGWSDNYSSSDGGTTWHQWTYDDWNSRYFLFVYETYLYPLNRLSYPYIDTFKQDEQNENVYVYNKVEDYEEETVIIEFLPEGGVKSMRIIRLEYSSDSWSGSKYLKGKEVIEITDINNTDFDLPNLSSAS